MSTLELVLYYVRLLILEYTGRPRAEGTIETTVTPVIMPQTSTQVITFSVAPTSGSFTLSYDENPSSAINWNDSNSTIQTKLRLIAGLEDVLVTGSISGLSLTVTFEGVFPPALILVLDSSTLLNGIDSVSITIEETDLTLPLAVQDAFNLVGSNIAAGVQLDVIGKYAGVTRSGAGFYGQITLDDEDFYTLIRMAIIQNSAGSSLYEIQGFIHQFFAGQMLVFDYQNMQMSYLISSSIGSQELIQMLVNQNLLPRPMAVQVALVIYAPVIDMFFGFRTYDLPAYNATPFNTYDDYQMDWPWLSYNNAIYA